MHHTVYRHFVVRSLSHITSRVVAVLSLLLPLLVNASSLEFFSSTAGNFDYARAMSLPTNFGSGEFTFEVWIKPNNAYPVGSTSTSSGQLQNWSNVDNQPYSRNDWWYHGNFLLDGFNNSSFASGTFALQVYGGGRVRWLFGDGSSLTGGVRSVGAYPASATKSLLDGKWHHVTLVRRWSGSSASLLELWIDGVLVDSETSALRTNMRQWWNSWSGYPQGGWFWGSEAIAAVQGSSWEDYKGLVDEIRFWSRAKSASEIQSSWNQPVYGSEQGLIGWYSIGERSGTQVCDTMTGKCMTLHRTSSATFDAEEAPAGVVNAGQIQLLSSSVSIGEDGSSATIRVTRSGGSSGSASVNYMSRDGTAFSGADYKAKSGTVSWSDGQTGERLIQLEIINDTQAETTEQFFIDLSGVAGAALSAPSSATISISANDQPAQSPSAGSTFSDSFDRANSSLLGNGWIEKTPASYDLQSGAVQKNGGTSDFRNNLLYRPASEDALDIETSVELRFQQFPVGYPALIARAQSSTISLDSRWDGYLLYINNSQTQATLARQTGAGWDTSLVAFTLNRSLNLTDRYRLRLRVAGSNPVRLTAYVERWAGSAWEALGQTQYNDSSSSRISTAGSVGVAADSRDHLVLDNFTRALIQ
jgi:hypothetical protein